MAQNRVLYDGSRVKGCILDGKANPEEVEDYLRSEVGIDVDVKDSDLEVGHYRWIPEPDVSGRVYLKKSPDHDHNGAFFGTHFELE